MEEEEEENKMVDEKREGREEMKWEMKNETNDQE